MADTLGSLLRARREALGLTLEEVERQTRLRTRHLQAIESDDLSTIPSVAQARGFIRSYASFLGVSAEEIDQRVSLTRPRPQSSAAPARTAAEPRPQTPSRTQPLPAVRPSFRRRYLRMDLLLGGFVTLATVGLLLWGGYHLIGALTASAPAVESPLLAETATPAADLETPDAAPPAAEGTPADGETSAATVVVPIILPTRIPTPLGGVYTDVRIHLTIRQRAYLKIEADGKILFARRVLPGDTCSPNPNCDFTGLRTVTVSTGNGAGIELIYNGVELGPMGSLGQAVSRSFTPADEIVPTAQPSPTPTITPTPAATPTPTP